MSDSTPLQVYIKPGCPWCVDAIAYLKRKGFDFVEIDVISNPEKFAEMEQLSGQTCAPTMLMSTVNGDAVLADFDVGELKEFFEKHGVEA